MCFFARFLNLAYSRPTYTSYPTIKRRDTLTMLTVIWLCTAAVPGLTQTPTAVPVPTWRYDLTHAGENTSETELTPDNVNVNSFGKLFSVSVDSTVYAQPLYSRAHDGRWAGA